MITLTVGIPASGKSTWSRQAATENNVVRICRDDLRQMLKSAQMLPIDGEDLVSQMVEFTIRQAIFKGYDVIVDQTNCNVKYLRKLISFCEHLDDTSLEFFDVSLEEAVERNSRREMKVPESVIHKMHTGYTSVRKEFKDFYPKVVQQKYTSTGSTSAIICDIDGTLATMSDRSPYDWARVSEDKLNIAVARAIEAYRIAGIKVLLFSGRDGICRSATQEWLNENDVTYDLLLMRDEGDTRPDTIVEREMFHQIGEKFNIIGVFDDRKSVKRMWVSLGLHVFDCNQFDEEF